MSGSDRESVKILARLILYIVIQGLALSGYVWYVIESGRERLGDISLDRLLRENGFLEFIQIGILVLIALMCVSAFGKNRPALHRLLFLCAIIGIFRELDSFLESALFENAHTLHMLAGVVILVSVAFRNRAELRLDIPEFILRPGFFLMLAGFTMIAVYAQILGQRDAWVILAPDLTSETKRFIEEGIEFMGYIVIAFGIVEERFFSCRKGMKPSE